MKEIPNNVVGSTEVAANSNKVAVAIVHLKVYFCII